MTMRTDRHTLLDALAGGLAGALTLTAIHETARRTLPDAPRMDTLGRRALASGFRAAGATPPRGERMQELALAGDVVSNTLYYSLVAAGRPETALARGAALGAVAGLGAIVLPPLLGLGRAPRGLTARTKAMTFTWYLAGGLAAAVAFRAIADADRR